MASLHVLVIDDEPALRQILSAAVKKAGYSVDQAATASEASSKLVRGDVDVALCDIKLPDGNGIDLLRDAKAAGLDTAFVMVTAFGSMETAVEALRAGAFDYVVKPVASEELMHRLAKIAAMRGLRDENKVLRKAVSDSLHKLYQFTSPAMQEVERLVRKVAPTDSTVLINGESGTGKGVTARHVHELSARNEGPFVTVNCSAIPENLMESEFFGHTKGAFTGADRARKGLFMEADGGTLFLDEIGELPLPMQTKLLHVIEDKMVRAVGGEQARFVNVRIVAATNLDLQEMVRQGRFREDLFFRLSMFRIAVPPLRERRADMHGLIRHMMRESKYSGIAVVDIDPLAEEALMAYRWPGNVRELDNVINRAQILAEGQVIALADLPQDITHALARGASGTAIASEGYLRDQLRRVEAGIIAAAIADAGGDRRLASQKLGIGLSSLYRKLDEFERDGLMTGAPQGDQTAHAAEH
jgi:DNA-binding NtrC family response regulator